MTAQQDGDREQREVEYLIKQIRQAQSVSLNQSEKLSELREKLAAKEDSNEAARYQIKSMQQEMESTRTRINHLEDIIEQRDDELRSSQAKINTGLNEQASVKYELKQIDNEICFYEE